MLCVWVHGCYPGRVSDGSRLALYQTLSIECRSIFFWRVLCAIVPFFLSVLFLKKNLNTSKPSEHPPVRGENVKTFRWDHRLQIQNLFMAFKRVPRRY